MDRKNITIITISMIVILVLIAILIFIYRPKSADPIFTGGSGIPLTGQLVLYGYETPTTNSKTRTPIGNYLSTPQQTQIRFFLEALLYNKKPLQEYKGTIVPGSVSMDYGTNVIAFKVKIEDPATIYTVRYTVTGTEIHVFGEDGKEITPPSE